MVECVRREGRWWIFKAGRMTGKAIANNTKTTPSWALWRCYEETLHCAVHLATEMMRRLTARATMRRLATETMRRLHR